jgi:hypothetical protein
MYEEIIINGKTMELDANSKGVQMVLQSPYLTDIKAIISNRTNTVTFPATPHNKAIIGCTSLQQESTFAYRKHRAIYKRDGVQMFDGKATLLSVTDKNIQMCFTWGNTDAFQKLFDTNLRELSLGRSRYPATLLSNPNNYMALINYGGKRSGVGVSVKKVLEAIETKCGVTGLQPLATVKGDNRLVMPLTSRNGDSDTRYAQRFRFDNNATSKLYSYGQFRYLLIGPDTSHMTDLHNYYDPDTKSIYTGGAKTARIRFNVEYMKYNYVGSSFPYPDGDPSKFVGLSVFKMHSPDIDNTSAVENLLAASIDSQQGEGPFLTRYSLTGDVQYDIDVEGYEYIALCVLWYDNYYAYSDAVLLSGTDISDISVVFDRNEGEEVMYDAVLGNSYPIGLNLPDMSCGQFIKNLLWLRGEFAFSQDGKKFEFASFNALKTNKSKAKDWTDKMITLQPKERQTTLDGTARKNYFRYAEADWYDRDQYSGTIKVDDETIQAETEYCKSDFALAPDNKIPVWSKNEDDTWDFAGNDIPPVLLVGPDANILINWLVISAGYSSMQRWSSILNNYYQQYANAIYHPVIIKAEFLITTADLNQLDMRIPVYLKQTGRYYAIRKLTTKNAKVAEVELIELK